MRKLVPAEVHARKIAELGLDPEAVDLQSTEGIAAAIRRVAGYLCPCTAVTLIRAVVRPLRGLVSDEEATKTLVENTLDAMLAHGDLLEERDVHEPTSTSLLLYAAPASFVVRNSGLVILLGVTTDHRSPLPDDLEHRIEYVGHVRRLAPMEGADLRRELRQLGLFELDYDRWLRSPPTERAANHLTALDHVLDATPPSRDIPGLILLDPASPVRYYKGRWVVPKAQSGRFVARRAQTYGADLWCYVELRDGHPERMIDLPVRGGRWHGYDEAWRLQMAIDAKLGRPQQFRVRAGRGAAILELFSPVPSWARRRWDALGEPAGSSGCLFSYRIATAEIDEERRFARESLWLEETNDSTRTG